MKISFDLDGTIYDHQEFFQELFKVFQEFGHTMGILTGHASTSEEADLRKLEAIQIYPDFYFGRTLDYIPLNGAHFKSMIIKREGIDIHFDDYDYDNTDTIRIFKELGEQKIFRVKSLTKLPKSATLKQDDK